MGTAVPRLKLERYGDSASEVTSSSSADPTPGFVAIYTGLLLIIGSAMAIGEWRAVLAFALASLALWRKKLRLEERLMHQQFGSGISSLLSVRPGAYSFRFVNLFGTSC